MEKEQLRKDLRATVLRAEKLEKELRIVRKLMEDEAADREYERAYMTKRIEELEERENRLHTVLPEHLRDDSCNESEPEGYDNDGDYPAEEGDITEHISWYRTTGREMTESSWNPRDSQERAEERSEGVGTVGTFSTIVSPVASMSDGNTDVQSEMCHICLFGLATQEVGTPEACSHSFCADCLQDWMKNTNICPIDRQVCDTILVRHCLGGEVVRRIHV
jgi:hypothetical protein